MFSSVLNKRYTLYWLLLFILLSRLPFIFSGYGTDADAWRIVQSGYNLYKNGVYLPSRFPGYPLPEFLSGAIWLTGLPFLIPWIFNCVSVLLSVAAVYYFVLISKIFLHREGYALCLPAVTFAFVPVFYINSTGMMDYNWALAFILGSVYFLLSDRIRISALFLALAAGCRITSSLLIIPVIYYLIYTADNDSRVKKVIEYISIVSLVAAVLFLPLIAEYGIRFLSFDRPTAPSLLVKVIGRMTVRTWGALGSLGILISIIGLVLNKKGIYRRIFTESKFVPFLLISILIYVILFITLPLDAGYLIPIVPFVILFFYRLSYGKIIIFLSVVMIASPFFLNIGGNNITLSGPVLIDAGRRISEENYINKVVNLAKSADGPYLIICESYLPKIQLTIELKKISITPNVNFVYMLSRNSLKKIVRRKNIRIFYLKNVRDETLNIYNYDLKSFEAREIL